MLLYSRATERSSWKTEGQKKTREKSHYFFYKMDDLSTVQLLHIHPAWNESID